MSIVTDPATARLVTHARARLARARSSRPLDRLFADLTVAEVEAAILAVPVARLDRGDLHARAFEAWDLAEVTLDPRERSLAWVEWQAVVAELVRRGEDHDIGVQPRPAYDYTRADLDSARAASEGPF